MRVYVDANEILVSCNDIRGCLGDSTTCNKCPLNHEMSLSINSLIEAVRTVTLNEVKDGYIRGYKYLLNDDTEEN